MKTEDIRKMAQAWQSVQEASKKKMDPVDQDELKGSHADRKDKDIDNDGDADKSDEYLHNRRKAISKAMKGKSDDTVTMSPKAERKESADWTVYNRILENRAMHYKGAAPADPMDKGQSPGGKKMKKDIDIDTSGKISNYDDLGHDDASKAGRVTKKAPGRTNDRSEGDKNIVNPVKDTTK